MAIYSDVTYFLAYIVGLIGDIVTAVGAAISAGLTTPGAMYKLTQGIFGANGGWIYWMNEENSWMIDQVKNSISFMFTP